VSELILTQAERAALAGCSTLEDLLEQLCPTYTDPEEDGL
jgi:hypothetical protein